MRRDVLRVGIVAAVFTSRGPGGRLRGTRFVVSSGSGSGLMFGSGSGKMEMGEHSSGGEITKLLLLLLVTVAVTLFRRIGVIMLCSSLR